MTDVIIDGRRYVPAEEGGGARIGIGITTHNRPEVLREALEKHVAFRPPGATYVIVDDGSADAAAVGAVLGPHASSDSVEIVAWDTSRGIVAAKNACLERLMDSGVEHIFLFDDDAWPKEDRWWEPYVASPEPHLSYQFLDLATGNSLGDLTVVHEDAEHVAYSGQRGVMLYYDRRAIEAVGGFDPVYGRGMYEHSDLANRIYARGLTTWRYADVAGSSDLIHSLDEHEAVERSVAANERRRQEKTNATIHNERRDAMYDAFVPFRERRNVVLTTLLTSEPDPQRGKKWAADPTILDAWAGSIEGAEPVVIADELNVAPAAVDIIYRAPVVAMNVYYRRWVEVYRWLRNHPEVDLVWVTDGSDVEMLREPWGEMRRDRIYVGSEPKVYEDDDGWCRGRHPAPTFQRWIDEHARDTLLNAGLLGGTRENVMAFAHRVAAVYYDLQMRRFWGTETSEAEVGDMLAFGMTAYAFPVPFETGPAVHTVFRADERNGYSWWKHR